VNSNETRSHYQWRLPGSPIRWGSRIKTVESTQCHGPVIVAVVAVGVVEVVTDQVVDVVAVRHGFVSAAGAVLMVGSVTFVDVIRAAVGIEIAYRQDVLVHMVLMRMVEVAIVDVVDMAFVFDGSVAAIRSVLVVVRFVCSVFVHVFRIEHVLP